MTLLMREEEIREESTIQGAIRVLKSMDMNTNEITERIIQTFQLTRQEAESYLNNGQ